MDISEIRRKAKALQAEEDARNGSKATPAGAVPDAHLTEAPPVVESYIETPTIQEQPGELSETEGLLSGYSEQEILENTGNTENDASGETAATEPLMPPPAYDDSSTDEAAAEPEVPESTAETINVSSVLTGEEDAKALAEEAVSKTSLLEATEENIEQAIKETIDVEELREVVGESAQPSSIEEEEENAEEATEKDADEMVQAISFMLDKEEYAIDVKYLKEIIQTRTLTDVPRAPAGLMGVLSLRGTIVPVINLRFRLGLPEDDNGEQIIIINDGEGYMGLLVDKVNHVLRIKKDTLEPSPSLNTINEDLISALGRHDRGAFILLNIERFLEKA